MVDLPEDRQFPLTGYGDEFVTGACPDGRQVVMGLLCPHLVAYFFDPAGRLLGDEHRPWDHPAPRLRDTGPYDIYDPPFQADWRAAGQFVWWWAKNYWTDPDGRVVST